MPVEEIVEGFLKVAVRLVFQFFVEVVFEYIFKAPGMLIGGFCSNNRDGPSNKLVLVISTVFWILIIGSLYYYVYER